MTSLAERRNELVGMLLFRRAAFHSEYRRVMNLSTNQDVSHIYDRDMLIAILEKEYPGEAIWPQELNAPRRETEGTA